MNFLKVFEDRSLGVISSRILLLFIVGFVISATPIFFAPKNYPVQVITWMAIAAAIAVVSVVWAKTKTRQAIGLAGSVFGASFITKLAYDFSIDPTSHNLLPFELAWVLVVTLTPAALLAVLAQWIVGKRARVKPESHPRRD